MTVITITPLMWTMAVLPIVALLFLMVGMRWPAKHAAPVSLGIVAVVAAIFYQAGPTTIVLEGLKGSWQALSILIVIFPAIFIFEITNETKAFQVFNAGMQRIAPNELLQILILGWCFTSFLQGITGFGVPVAVGAPLLVGLGVSPIWAVIIPPIGHSWGNTFGTLALAWDAMSGLTGLYLDPEMYLRTAFLAAVLIGMWNAASGILICLFYGGIRGLKKGFLAVLVISLIQGVGQLLFTQFNTTLATFVPASAALLVGILLGRTKMYGEPWKLEDSRIMRKEDDATGASDGLQHEGPKDMTLHHAFLPYYALTAITLIVLLIPPVRSVASTLRIGFAFPETTTGLGIINPATQMFAPITVFTHAGVFLLTGALIGFFFYSGRGWIKEKGGSAVWQRTIKRTIPASITVVSLVTMSRIMIGTGQIEVLAQGVALVLGSQYVLLAPMVGVLGSFMTSSNMASNILFGAFQETTARLLYLDTAVMLAAQTAGGAIGTTIAPGNIVLGVTTVGILGQEGAVLKKILPITVFFGALMGVVAYALMFFL